MASILIKDTTSMERIQIVKDALDGEYDEFYDDYSRLGTSTVVQTEMESMSVASSHLWNKRFMV